MRIIQVVQRPQRRGAEIFASQLSGELRRTGHQVRVVYLYPHEGSVGLTVTDDDVELMGRVSHPLERIPGVHPRLTSRLLHVIDEFQPDVVQVNGGRTSKYGALAARLRPTREWVLISRNIGNVSDWVQGWQRRTYYRQLVIPCYDGIVGVSQTTLDSLASVCPLAVPTVVIPRAVDPAQLVPKPVSVIRREMGAGSTQSVLVFAGSLAPEKRLDLLLEAALLVRQQLPDLQVWILGDGPLRSALANSGAARRLEGAVHFLGVVADVSSYVHAADVLLLSSDTEGVPGAVLEAGFLGTPAIATRVGGVPECVIDGTTGLLVDPGDIPGLAGAALALLGDPGRRTTMGDEARRWVTEHFLIGKAARRYLQFYREVSRARPHGGVAQRDRSSLT